MNVMVWFYNHRNALNPLMDGDTDDDSDVEDDDSDVEEDEEDELDQVIDQVKVEIPIWRCPCQRFFYRPLTSGGILTLLLSFSGSLALQNVVAIH